MKTRTFKNLIVLWLALGQSLVFAVQLTVWTPKANGPHLILPVPDGGDAGAAATAYLERVYAAKDLSSAMESEWLTTASGKFTALSKKDGPVFVILDNSFEDRKDEVRAFERAGANTYLVPMGAELAVSSASDRAEFRRLLADAADAMVSIGGADIAPSVYGDDVTFAKKTNVKRDKMELAILKEFLNNTSKPLFGICRGHQIIGVLLGYKLHQDLGEDIGAPGHESGHHNVDIVEGSVLSGFLGGELSAKVNSFHHQGVNLSSKSRGKLHATAMAGDVVEGIESKDGRVVTVQFHPELMNGAVGKAIMKGFVERVR